MIYKIVGDANQELVGFDVSFENLPGSVGVDLSCEGHNGAYAEIDKDDFIKAALAIMADDDPGDLTAQIQQVAEILQRYQFTVNGGIMPDDVAYKACAVDILALMGARGR
jgi:hypothetical protein